MQLASMERRDGGLCVWGICLRIIFVCGTGGKKGPNNLINRLEEGNKLIICHFPFSPLCFGARCVALNIKMSA